MLTDQAIHKEYGATVHRIVFRESDMLMYDFAAKAFAAAPGQPLDPMPEQPFPAQRFYVAAPIGTPAAQFTDGCYLSVFVTNSGHGGAFGMARHVFRGGEEVDVFPMSASIPFTWAGAFNLNTPPAK